MGCGCGCVCEDWWVALVVEADMESEEPVVYSTNNITHVPSSSSRFNNTSKTSSSAKTASRTEPGKASVVAA
jgi:hypothetical protein